MKGLFYRTVILIGFCLYTKFIFRYSIISRVKFASLAWMQNIDTSLIKMFHVVVMSKFELEHTFFALAMWVVMTVLPVQKQPPEFFFKKVVHENFTKFTVNFVNSQLVCYSFKILDLDFSFCSQYTMVKNQHSFAVTLPTPWISESYIEIKIYLVPQKVLWRPLRPS